jgi:hypothetical protein
MPTIKEHREGLSAAVDGRRFALVDAPDSGDRQRVGPFQGCRDAMPCAGSQAFTRGWRLSRIARSNKTTSTSRASPLGMRTGKGFT